MIYLKEGEKHPNQTKVTKEVLKKRKMLAKGLKYQKAATILRKTDEVKPTSGLAVDASVLKKGRYGKVGIAEIRGVDIETGKIVFNKKISWETTNNLAEYLALYIGFLYLDKEGKELVIYSDSTIAISWVRNGKCKTEYHSTDPKQQHNIIKAERRTKEKWGNVKAVRFWNKKEWGENPADFGRKQKKTL